MTEVVDYEIATGKIICSRFFSGPEVAPGPGIGRIVGRARSATHYVSGGVLLPRPANSCVIDKITITANGSDAATISNVPAGSLLIINGPVSASQEINDGSAVFTTDTPGTYAITIDCFPETAAEFTVTAQ